MTASPSSVPVVHLTTYGDYLALIPYLMGFNPDPGSIVVCIHDEPELRGLHISLPADTADLPSVLQDCLHQLQRDGVGKVLLVGYGPGWQITPAMDGFDTLLANAGIAAEMIRADEGRYWSYTCHDPECCPPDGVPYDVSSSAVAATAVLAGLTALPSRQAFQDQLAPAEGPDREQIKAATQTARTRVLDLLATDPDYDWFAHGQRLLHEAFDHVQAGRALPVEDVAWLSILLTNVNIRDIGLTLISQYGIPAAQQLWTELVRRVEPGYAAPAAANLAHLHFLNGDLMLARIALSRALEVQPSDRWAGLIATAIVLGIRPETLSEAFTDQMPEIAETIRARIADSPGLARPALAEPLPRP